MLEAKPVARKTSWPSVVGIETMHAPFHKYIQPNERLDEVRRIEWQCLGNVHSTGSGQVETRARW